MTLPTDCTERESGESLSNEMKARAMVISEIRT
jgi:hypothetical protein